MNSSVKKNGVDDDDDDGSFEWPLLAIQPSHGRTSVDNFSSCDLFLIKIRLLNVFFKIVFQVCIHYFYYFIFNFGENLNY